MNSARQLLPLAIAVVVIAGLTWVLLERDSALGTWLLAGLILAHGWAHLAFVFPKPEPANAAAGGMDWPFDFGASWLVGRIGLDAGSVRAAGIALMAATVATSLLAAPATIGILVPTEWWSGLVVGEAVCSALLLALCFSPAFLIGFGIDLALLWLVFLSGWSPAG